MCEWEGERCGGCSLENEASRCRLGQYLQRQKKGLWDEMQPTRVYTQILGRTGGPEGVWMGDESGWKVRNPIRWNVAAGWAFSPSSNGSDEEGDTAWTPARGGQPELASLPR